MTDANIFTGNYEYDSNDPPGYRGAMNRVGKLAGGKDLIVKAFELPPGEKLCPYHYEYVEEWLLIINGALTLRSPTGLRELQAGDVVCFPRGADGAHQVTNNADETARFVMFSSAATPSVAVYPDGDKIGVWTDNERDDFMFRREDAHREYYDREL